MWQAIAYVTSGLTLAAFLAAAAAWAYRNRLLQQERLIRTAPEAERAALVARALEFFDVNTEKLTRTQQFELARQQILAKALRSRQAAWIVVTVAILTASVAAFAIYRWQTAEEPRSVWIYLVARLDAGGTEALKAGEFTVRYRGPHGPQLAHGQNGSAMAGNVSWEAMELEVDGIECFGFIPKKLQAGESLPWKYPIVGGKVNIEMVMEKPSDDPMPEPGQVVAMIKSRQLTEADVLKPGKYSKRQVSLTIENESDRSITFVVCDCAAVTRPRPDVAAAGKVWTWRKDSRRIQPRERLTWGTFERFDNPTGWFALFVRYDDRTTNRVVQQPLGVYNLFLTREPKIVVERNDVSGVGYQVSERSQLGE